MTTTHMKGASERAEPSLIVLGLDDSGKAHASWFNETDKPLAIKAAGMMGMTALRVATDELQALAAQLPPGRVFASGRAFVPFVKAKLFDQLSRHAKTEAVTITSVDRNAAAGGGDDGPSCAGEPYPQAETDQPMNWSGIGIGHVVLASITPKDGWWEAVVVRRLSDELLELRWKGWADWDSFIRRPEHLALLHPSVIALLATGGLDQMPGAPLPDTAGAASNQTTATHHASNHPDS